MMNRFWVRALAWAALAVAWVLMSFGMGYYTRALADVYPALRLPLPGTTTAAAEADFPLLRQIRGLLDARYIAPLPPDTALEYGAARGMVSAIGDPYTVFVEPQAHELETQSLQGEYGGIGTGLSQNDTGEIVLSPFPDSPAEQAGVQKGDILLAVDGTALTTPMTLEAVTALVRGPIGTQVKITVRHTDGAELTASIERQRIELPSVTWQMIEGQPAIGLIAISRFSGKTENELQRALDELHAQGATRYILDLRNNGGGILEAGINVAAQFVDGGVVMYETQRDAPENKYTVPANTRPAATAPLAVLVNHNTASAAEIVAGALLDRNRAPLIGQATYGKGSVQLIYDLPEGASLHVTAYRWYTPTHREIDKVGLPPTIAVEPATDGSDAELGRAIEYLLSQP